MLRTSPLYHELVSSCRARRLQHSASACSSLEQHLSVEVTMIAIINTVTPIDSVGISEMAFVNLSSCKRQSIEGWELSKIMNCQTLWDMFWLCTMIQRAVDSRVHCRKVDPLKYVLYPIWKDSRSVVHCRRLNFQFTHLLRHRRTYLRIMCQWSVIWYYR